jgi:oligopeptide transport system permease protein
MGKYLLKRIFFSILSIIAVMFIMMVLLFTFKNSDSIFYTDTALAKLKENKLDLYKKQKLEKYDYIDLVEYSTYINNKYGKDPSISSDELKSIKKLPYYYVDGVFYSDKDKTEVAENSDYLNEYKNYYESKHYKVTFNDLVVNSKGNKVTGGDPTFYATKNHGPFVRLWRFFSNMFSFDTTSYVENELASEEEDGTLAQTNIPEGIYLLGDFDEYENLTSYQRGLNFQLKKVDNETENGFYHLGLTLGIDVSQYDNNQTTCYLSYYDGTSFAKITDDFIVSESGEYTFTCLAKGTSLSTGMVYRSIDEGSFNVTKLGDTPLTSIHLGEKYPVQKYVKIIWDTYSNMPAIIGSGTYHRYLVYFDNKFPFIHQNIVSINIGTSLAGSTQGSGVIELFNEIQGEIVTSDKELPAQIGTGVTTTTALDMHTLTYNFATITTDFDKYGFDNNYTSGSYAKSGKSRVGYSFTLGIVATIISYCLGVPLGVLMARKKDTWIDKIGMGYIIFIIAVPSLAYIFILRSLGKSIFNLPISFSDKTNPAWLVYVLPVISLVLPSIAGLMKWLRRYVIDQSNSDYVKFARSQGFSEGEIFTKHVLKNAMIPIVHGIPGEIISCITGAYITEKLYGIPGTGSLMISSINNSDNSLILGITFFYSFLTILSLILGDVLMAIVDPRISFSSGGKK